MTKLLLAFCLLLSCTMAFGQPVEMADAMRSSGKIYVVIAIIVIVFVGLALYLFSIDRRLKKIENSNQSKK